MKRRSLLLCVFAALLLSVYAFAPGTDDIETAYQNARKGVNWGLANLKNKKSKLDNTLIADDKLIADIKIGKEIDGVKITATGYCGTTEVSVTAYRSLESLLRDGYIDKNSELLK